MADFLYHGRNRAGKNVKGNLSGASANAVAETLIQQGITPLKIQPRAAKTAQAKAKPQNRNANKSTRSNQAGGKAKAGLRLPGFFKRNVPLPDLIMFIRQMYSLTKAGISMLRAIEGLAENATNRQLGEALKEICEQLERGRGLSTAMAEHPKVFPRLVVAVVHVGENTGRLEQSFAQLAVYLEGELDTRKRIKSATRYPMFVSIFLVAAVIVLNIFVIPQFSSMFASFDVELPLITRMLLASSSFFLNYTWVLILIIVGVILGTIRWLKQPHARERWDGWKLKMPAVGDILERSLLARFCRSFSVMLNSGVPLTQALGLVSETLDNQYMSVRVGEMRKGIERGESLLRVSRNSELFTPLVLQMVAVGEETGSLDDLLVEAAEYYEREVDYDLKNITARIEPIMISVVAVMVLFLALGIFLPMWEMMGAYGGGM
ncbi:MSHA biogenesis protein MshG [Aliidiomarina shirensis]|uniref:MSHA biogenesis protein MshG n=1 Tax=Aliidiomarina shirensis TaxID=1048642 RepID=A0A432WV11_9GAMM|nr:type II secretion system F family protein [Aliidiomarina shirensis]RUO37602.1 MSHA biogenesis protein MshG [Aliidiomarina shirensis]